MAENNKPNTEKDNEVIGVCALLCGIPSIRIVINNKNMDLDNDLKFKRICSLLEEFIMSIDYKNM